MTKKQFLRSVIFFLLVFAMLFTLCDIFELINTSNFSRRFYTYRNLPEDTVDAVYIGTSGLDRYIINPKIYEEYGMSIFPLTVDALPCWLYTNMIEEAYTYQNPELLIIDTRSFGQDNVKTETMDASGRRVIDIMDFFSINRLKVAFKTMKQIHAVDEKQSRFDLSYIFSFIKYHSKWEEEDFRFKNNIGSVPHQYAGFTVNTKNTVNRVPQEAILYDLTYQEDLDPMSEEALYELLDYIEEKDLNVMFLDTPEFRTKKQMGRANRINQIIEDAGYPLLQFYTSEEAGKFTIDLDVNTDFYDESHVNYYGAIKFTDYFADYLDENYDLPDRRNDENAAKYWDGIYETLINKIESLEKKKSS